MFVQPVVAARVELSPLAKAPATAQPEAATARVAWLSPRHVSAAVRVQHGAFSACRTLAGSAYEATGDDAITLGWCVEPSGAVSEVALDRTTFENPRINECMLSVAREVRFPAPPTRTEVSWTVRFRDTDDDQLARGPIDTRL